jgi:hypothetical protein
MHHVGTEIAHITVERRGLDRGRDWDLAEVCTALKPHVDKFAELTGWQPYEAIPEALVTQRGSAAVAGSPALTITAYGTSSTFAGDGLRPLATPADEGLTSLSTVSTIGPNSAILPPAEHSKS